MKIRITNFKGNKIEPFKCKGKPKESCVIDINFQNRTIKFLEDDLSVVAVKYNKIAAFLETINEEMKETYQVPMLPRVPDEIWKGVIVPALVIKGAIPKSSLIIGKSYKGECRNSETATWLGNKFEYIRTKFGSSYPETINHFEDDDGYDLFVPIAEV